jgi:hypothetical protein
MYHIAKTLFAPSSLCNTKDYPIYYIDIAGILLGHVGVCKKCLRLAICELKIALRK